MAARGGASFPYMATIGNFENLLLQNYWSDFKIIL